jgi:hypothetical protein
MMSVVNTLPVSNPRTSSASAPLIDLDRHTVEYGVTACSVAPGDKAEYVMPGGRRITNAQLYAFDVVGSFGPVEPFKG